MPGPKSPNLDGELQTMLRMKIAASGSLLIDISRATGVEPAALGRFLRKEQTLRLDGAEALCKYFGIQFVTSW